MTASLRLNWELLQEQTFLVLDLLERVHLRCVIGVAPVRDSMGLRCELFGESIDVATFAVWVTLSVGTDGGEAVLLLVGYGIRWHGII